MTPAPPPLAAWLAALRLHAGRRDFVLGDLEEEFHARAAVSAAAARRWYWRQAVRCLRGSRTPPVPTAIAPGRDPIMRSFLSDLRLATRVFRRAPGFAFAVVAVLALGIGANTAIFSIVNAVLLRPLPFDEPDRLVRLFHIPVMLLAAVALVLLIACANVGNLILARAMGRRKEIAIRAALGAGRRRMFQHLLAESLVLALAGGAAGLLLANLAIGSGRSLLSNQIPRAEEASIDGAVLLFVLAASLLTGVLAGAIPALRAGRADLNDTLKEGGRSDSAGAGLLTRRALIVAEVALSLILLMGAGVMLRSLHALRAVDSGFNAEHVLKMDLDAPDARYPQPAQKRAFYDAVLARFRALPGAVSAGYSDTLPLTGGGSVQPIVVEGRPELKPSEQPTVAVRETSAGYMKTMEIPILRGRDFGAADRAAVLISAAAANLLWGNDDPVGHRVTLPLVSRTQMIDVVGIVGDVKETLAEKAPAAVYYYQRDLPFAGFSVAIRTSGGPDALAKAAVAAVHDIDPQLPVQAVHSMREVIEERLVAERFRVLLLQCFAAAALTLASVGIYSVLSYLVRGRRREIGIRTALGASTSDVLRLVVLEGMKPALLGIALGAAGALGSARLLEKLVFGVKPYDPRTLAVVAAALLGVSIAASLLPAWRAARLDPITVLRD